MTEHQEHLFDPAPFVVSKPRKLTATGKEVRPKAKPPKRYGLVNAWPWAQVVHGDHGPGPYAHRVTGNAGGVAVAVCGRLGRLLTIDGGPDLDACPTCLAAS